MGSYFKRGILGKLDLLLAASMMLTILADRYPNLYAFHTIKVSKSGLSKHQNSRFRWRAMPAEVWLAFRD